ncbi:hypothetical protein [Nocardia concava]|uniref:hypothetical protein n=1 Tax=Nocardia concava TaxID=257281 RepID=UPI0002E4FB98|nr:hypothetical protein [Nocardia concava]
MFEIDDLERFDVDYLGDQSDFLECSQIFVRDREQVVYGDRGADPAVVPDWCPGPVVILQPPGGPVPFSSAVTLSVDITVPHS